MAKVFWGHGGNLAIPLRNDLRTAPQRGVNNHKTSPGGDHNALRSLNQKNTHYALKFNPHTPSEINRKRTRGKAKNKQRDRS
jgi:hypothetical protein